MGLWTRRKFFLASLAGSAAAGATSLFGKTPLAGGRGSAAEKVAASVVSASAKRPGMISSPNGLPALGRGMEVLEKGGDTLDAAVAAVTVVEDDPNDTSVGFGGLPNEDGETELAASGMHGPTRRAGSVASVRRIKNVS